METVEATRKVLATLSKLHEADAAKVLKAAGAALGLHVYTDAELVPTTADAS